VGALPLHGSACRAKGFPVPREEVAVRAMTMPSGRGWRVTWLNRIDRILISTGYTFFSGSTSKKNSRLSVLSLERFEDE
jgi:hypothetical protein